MGRGDWGSAVGVLGYDQWGNQTNNCGSIATPQPTPTAPPLQLGPKTFYVDDVHRTLMLYVSDGSGSPAASIFVYFAEKSAYRPTPAPAFGRFVLHTSYGNKLRVERTGAVDAASFFTESRAHDPVTLGGLGALGLFGAKALGASWLVAAASGLGLPLGFALLAWLLAPKDKAPTQPQPGKPAPLGPSPWQPAGSGDASEPSASSGDAGDPAAAATEAMMQGGMQLGIDPGSVAMAATDSSVDAGDFGGPIPATGDQYGGDQYGGGPGFPSDGGGYGGYGGGTYGDGGGGFGGTNIPPSGGDGGYPTGGDGGYPSGGDGGGYPPGPGPGPGPSPYPVPPGCQMGVRILSPDGLFVSYDCGATWAQRPIATPQQPPQVPPAQPTQYNPFPTPQPPPQAQPSPFIQPITTQQLQIQPPQPQPPIKPPPINWMQSVVKKAPAPQPSAPLPTATQPQTFQKLRF